MSRPVEGWELSAYVDGDLPARRMTEIEDAIQRSPALRTALDEMLADHRALGSLDHAGNLAPGALPSGFERQAETLSMSLTKATRGSWLRPLSAVAGTWRQAAMLCAGIAFGWAAASWAATHPDPLHAFIDEATEIHRVAVIAASFSQEPSAAALEGLGVLFAHRIVPPNLGDAGFELIRIDVAATDSGPAAVLFYTDPEARRVSLVLSFDSPILDALGADIPDRPTAPRVTTHDGLAVSFGEGDGIAFAIVGSIPEPRARQLATIVTASLRQ